MRLTQPSSKVPFAVSELTSEHIQAASLQLSLDEPLQTIPGVFVLNPYNYAQDSRIAIRGFGARANFGIPWDSAHRGWNPGDFAGWPGECGCDRLGLD